MAVGPKQLQILFRATCLQWAGARDHGPALRLRQGAHSQGRPRLLAAIHLFVYSLETIYETLHTMYTLRSYVHLLCFFNCTLFIYIIR